MRHIRMQEIFALSPQKQLQMVEAIWNSLAKYPSQVPVPKSHLRVLEKRLAAYEANPGDTKSWEEVKAGAIKKLAK